MVEERQKHNPPAGRSQSCYDVVQERNSVDITLVKRCLKCGFWRPETSMMGDDGCWKLWTGSPKICQRTSMYIASVNL